MFFNLFERREVSVRVVSNDELIMATLRTNSAIWGKLNDLDGLSRAVPALDGHFEVLIEH